MGITFIFHLTFYVHSGLRSGVVTSVFPPPSIYRAPCLHFVAHTIHTIGSALPLLVDFHRSSPTDALNPFGDETGLRGNTCSVRSLAHQPRFEPQRHRQQGASSLPLDNRVGGYHERRIVSKDQSINRHLRISPDETLDKEPGNDLKYHRFQSLKSPRRNSQESVVHYKYVRGRRREYS